MVEEAKNISQLTLLPSAPRPLTNMAGVRSVVALVALLALLCAQASAIKFQLQARKHPEPLCIWNYALQDTLAIISINVVPTDPGKATQQKVAAKVIDRTFHNVYLNKPNIVGETRLAISTHHSSDLGVCLTNTGCALFAHQPIRSLRLWTWTCSSVATPSTIMQLQTKSLCLAWRLNCASFLPLLMRFSRRWTT